LQLGLQREEVVMAGIPAILPVSPWDTERSFIQLSIVANLSFIGVTPNNLFTFRRHQKSGFALSGQG
jgi:hypothetical protein